MVNDKFNNRIICVNCKRVSKIDQLRVVYNKQFTDKFTINMKCPECGGAVFQIYTVYLSKKR